MPSHERHPLTAAIRTRLPRRTVRLRLTLLYGGLFLLAGAALLAITYALVERATSDVSTVTLSNGATISIDEDASSTPPGPDTGPRPNVAGPGEAPTIPTVEEVRAIAAQQHADQMHQLLVQSGVALAAMAVFSIGLGWFVAGRVLLPLRTITATARDISTTNLHQRLALDGPDDE